MMFVHEICEGSPVEVDCREKKEEFALPAVTQLELPNLERLLPVGPTPDVTFLTERLQRSLTQDCCSSMFI